MKCPYRDFAECIVQECPSCVYEQVKRDVLAGRKPHWMSDDEALKGGCLWKETKTEYKFISCKLVENGTQPIPSKKEIINNTMSTRVSIHKSIF